MSYKNSDNSWQCVVSSLCFLLCSSPNLENDKGLGFSNKEMGEILCLVSKEESIALTNNYQPIATILFIKSSLDLWSTFRIRWSSNILFGYLYCFIEHFWWHFTGSNCYFLIWVCLNNHLCVSCEFTNQIIVQISIEFYDEFYLCDICIANRLCFYTVIWSYVYQNISSVS